MEQSSFFSGFALKGEVELFKEYISLSPYEVVGFSYGAIRAFEYALHTSKRVDRVVLLSPAFFLDCSKKFKRTQLIYFNKDPKTYIDSFLKNIAHPKPIDLKKFRSNCSSDELEELLNYNWSIDKLQKLVNKRVDIEVYLGSSDKIIDSTRAYEHFKKYATVYYLKDKGHIL
jgi:pimeloyl-ACP methyl ester carboxylesterase